MGPAELHGEVGGPQQPLGAARGILAERGGLFEGGDGGRDAAAARRAIGGFVQGGGDGLVGAGGRRGPVQHLPVRLTVQHLGERGVRGPSLCDGCGLLDRRADERVPEAQLGAAHRDELGLHGRLEIGELDGDAGHQPGRAEDLREGRAVVHGRDPQQVLADLRQGAEPIGEGALEAFGQRQVRAVRGGGRAEGARQLGQRQGVADRLGEQAAARGR